MSEPSAEQALPTALRVGCHLDTNDGPRELIGFVIDAPESESEYDLATEYAVLRDGLRRELIPLRQLSPKAVTKAGPDSLEGVEAHPVSAGWNARFDAMLTPRPNEPAMTPSLFDQALDEEGTIVVAGGAVRDVLLGHGERQGDLDLAGTFLPRRFREMILAMQTAPVRGDHTRLDDRYAIGLARDVTVVKVWRDTRARWDDKEKAIEYSPLRISQDRHDLSQQPTWFFGTSFATDSRWRDLTCNTLLYQPRTGQPGVVYDPTGHGLADLGLAPASLRESPDAIRRRPLCLCPIDPPESMPAKLVVQRVARLVKQILRYAGPDDDLGDVSEWSHRNESRLRGALMQVGPTADNEHMFTGELRGIMRNEDLDRVKARTAEYERWLGRQLWELIDPLLPPGGPARASGQSGSTQLHQHAVAVAPLLNVGGHWRLDLDRREGPSDETTRTIRRYFAGRFVGYRHTAVSVMAGGREIGDILALAPPFGEGVWYAELDALGRPISVDEQELEAFREREKRR